MDAHHKHKLIAKAQTIMAPCYAQPDLLFVRGEGCMLYDEKGKAYFDMTSGIAVTALGHGSDVFQKAVTEAATGLVHTSNLFWTAPAVDLAGDLVESSFADKVFFCNSGTEANEAAIKFARLYGGESRRNIVFFSGSFHGRTFGSLAATAKPPIKTPFEPLPGGFVECPWNEPSALQTIDHHTAAVIMEPIQGESGVQIPDQEWVEAVRERCDEVGALLIFDEVQVGVGRTGHLWAYEAIGVRPDIMTLAKPLGGGLPIGAVLLTDKAAQSITPGCHGTTFGGGPFVASVARRVFESINDEAFLAEVRRKGAVVGEGLRDIDSPMIKAIRGRGLIWAVELHEPAAEIITRCREAGLLLVAAGEHVIRFLPPLNAKINDLEASIKILKKIISSNKES